MFRWFGTYQWSLPGLTRQSILLRKKMDARVKPAHDAGRMMQAQQITV
jgi:hypothetical protein